MSYNQIITNKGTVLHRFSKTGVGKLVGSHLYLHINYLWDIPEDVFPRKMVEQAVGRYQPTGSNAKGKDKPFFQCARLCLKSREIRLDEAAGFDTEREPEVGLWVRIGADGKISAGHSTAIWHHKWLWVKPDYTGFDIQESIRWSGQYIPLINGSPSGSARKFNEQLNAVGLD